MPQIGEQSGAVCRAKKALLFGEASESAGKLRPVNASIRVYKIY